MKKHLLFVLLSIFAINTANANLLISPTRVMFDGRDRVKDIILINTSNQTRSYRMEWLENQTDEFGNYSTIPEDQVSYAASEYIRYSPRQVTLKPGDKQNIKLMVRRKNNMSNPEYRSHLRFTALPPSIEGKDTDTQGIAFKINVLTSYVVPVILRTSEPEITVAIDSVKIIRDKSGNPNIRVKMSKNGNYSSSGELYVFLKKVNMNEKRIGVLRGVNIFHEKDSLTSDIIWQNYEAPHDGSLRVEYVGTDEFKGRVLAESTARISIADF